VNIKYDRKRSEIPMMRRKSAKAIDFHGIFLCDFGVYLNRRLSLSSVGRGEY
jgi:hypothetical protein